MGEGALRPGSGWQLRPAMCNLAFYLEVPGQADQPTPYRRSLFIAKHPNTNGIKGGYVGYRWLPLRPTFE